MTNDESPVDVAANGAAPPADGGVFADLAETTDPSSAATTSPASRRRRTPQSSATRSRKRDSAKPGIVGDSPAAATSSGELALGDSTVTPKQPLAPTAEPQTAAENATTDGTAKPPARRRGTGTPRASAAPRARSQKAEAASPAAAVTPDSSPAPSEMSTEAGNGAVAGTASLESVDLPHSTDAASEEATAVPTRSQRPRRRSGRRGSAVSETVDAAASGTDAEVNNEATVPVIAETAASEDVADAEALSAETAAPPSRSRRRGGRSRRKPTDVVVAEAGAAEPVEAAAPAPAGVPPTVEQKPKRGRRGTGRQRTEVAETTEEPGRSGGRVVTRRGVVELQINGEPVPSVIFFGNVETDKEARQVAGEAQRAAQNGVHIHSTLVELRCPLPPDDSVYETFDSRIETLLKADPKGFVIPRIVFAPAPGWRRQYPNEVNHYSDGTTDDPSIASNHFWLEAESSLTALIEHVQRTGYGERVIGYHLERGEWFHPSEGGYDRSYANREAFRAWLRVKYKNSEAGLRAAWYDGQVQFYTAEIPQLPASPRPEVAFFEPRRERRWIDFLEYTSEVTADRLISLSRAVKTASNNRALVSVCYGYTFEFGHTYSGHLALGRLLQASSIDMVAGPPSYRDREAGGAGSSPSPVDSMPVHGKLWLSEDDTKTYLSPTNSSPDDFNPRIDSKWSTEQVHKRAMGRALAHRSGVAWMDTWGEGWLDSEDIWKSISQFTDRAKTTVSTHKAWSPEVAVLVDERSLLHVQKGDGFIRRLLRDQREMFEKSGASVGFYLQSDVMAKSFPTEAKLYVFLTPYRLPADHRAAIKEKLLRAGKTVVWMFAPGVCDSRGEPEEGAYELLGITLRQQSWNSEIGSKLTDVRHPITEGNQNRLVGTRERLNPSFSVDDESKSITVVGEYQQSGLPSIAVREMDGWRSVFCGEPTLSPDLIRGLYRFAGVHVFLPSGEDYLFAGDGWLTVHAVRDGNRTVNLPPSRDLYSLDEGKLVAQNQSEYRTFMKARTTYSFFVGSLDDMKRIGLTVEKAATPRRRNQRAPQLVSESGSGQESLPGIAPDSGAPADPFADGAESSGGDSAVDIGAAAAPAPLVVSNRDGVDGEAESAESDDIDGEESADAADGADGAVAGETAEAAERRRRRRRRGGRGRGRRIRPAGAQEGGTTPPAA